MLNKAMADAAPKGVVARNVVALADAPSVKGHKQGWIKAWDAAQLRVFLDAVRSHRLHPAFHLAAHTGMRRGEVLGLRWCDLDLEAGRLSVRQTLVSIGYNVQFSGAKTGTGRRTIDLDPGTVDVLKAWRIERAEEKGGADPVGEELVFTKADGSRIHPHSFSQILDRKVAKLDARRDTDARSEPAERVVAIDMVGASIDEMPALTDYLKTTPDARHALAVPARLERLLGELATKQWRKPRLPREPLLGDRLDVFVAVSRALDLARWRRIAGRPVRGEPVPDSDEIAQRARAMLTRGVAARVEDHVLLRAVARHLATGAWPFDVLVS